MSVSIRKVKTALQTEYRKAGGIRVEDAIAKAGDNLSALSEQCAERIDEVLGIFVETTADPRRPLTVDELRQLHGLINEMLTCCAPLEIEGFVETLYSVGRLVEAMMVADVWLDGALTPAVNLLRLVRRGALGTEDRKVLNTGVDQCTARFRGHARLAAYQPGMNAEEREH